MIVNVLGVDYTVRGSDSKSDPYLTQMDGYTDTSTKECVVDIMESDELGSKRNLPEYRKQVTRHELIHAFLHESGLAENSWATNEEMVDWFAIQAPKLLRAFEQADCL